MKNKPFAYVESKYINGVETKYQNASGLLVFPELPYATNHKSFRAINLRWRDFETNEIIVDTHHEKTAEECCTAITEYYKIKERKIKLKSV
jgi:hypothetical protein